jgi:hypothetical protein
VDRGRPLVRILAGDVLESAERAAAGRSIRSRSSFFIFFTTLVAK